MTTTFRLRARGNLPKGDLFADYDSLWHCGDVKDGVSIQFPGESASFVVSLTDLEKLVCKLKKRENDDQL